MKKLLQLTMMVVIMGTTLSISTTAQEEKATNENKLVVVWTSGDIEVAEKMVFMYVYNAKRAGWFDDVTFIIWGPSAKLLAENEMLQGRVAKMKEIGITLEACIACARMYDVDDDLKELGVDVKGMGTVLSNYLKDGYKIMTY